jgi:hypothetical protein
MKPRENARDVKDKKDASGSRRADLGSFRSLSPFPKKPVAEGFSPPHGGYEKLISFQKARIVYDGTVRFCERLLKKSDRTYDQMVQAARSVPTTSSISKFANLKPPSSRKAVCANA